MVTCETGQVLLAGVPGGFSRGTPVFAPPTVWCFSYELNNLERDVKLNFNKYTRHQIKISIMYMFRYMCIRYIRCKTTVSRAIS